MSWTKRPQGGAVPPSGLERQPYAAAQAQPFGNQEQMYPNYQGGAAGTMLQQQQFWQLQQQPQQPQPQYNQQYGQVYQQQDYPANANQFYPQTNTYNNMNYPSQGFNSTPQVRYPQQNYYQNPGLENQGQQQNFSQTKPNADSWEDNWDWGWGEDSSKQGQKAPQNVVQQQQQQALPPQQQVFHNANIIEESFARTDTNCWNWAMDDKKESTEPAPMANDHETPTLPNKNAVQENNTIPETVAPRSANSISASQADEVRTLNDRDIVKERLPNLALGKRFHLDNLTPQWSIESQMSQESSDGPHTQSEGTYRSENQSRNSSKDSPGLNTDNSNFNYSQVALDEGFAQNSEWTRPSQESTLANSTQSNSRKESHDDLSSSLQEMSLTNHENPSTDGLHDLHDTAPRHIQEPLHEAVSRHIHEAIPATQPPPAVSPASFPAPLSVSVPAMPPPSSVSSVPPPSSTPLSLTGPPPSSSAVPPNIPPTSNSNPFKHAGPFSHKSLAKGSPSTPSLQTLPPQIASTNLTSPAVVGKVSQHSRVSVGFEANLETTPDNSERPDQPQVSAFRPLPVSQQVPDNMEVAPRNDRNEYLQTAHLSSGDFGENTDFSRGVPAGLRRMVVGQQESEYSQNLNISGDEPPPGLARMVPGQQTEIDTGYNQPGDNYLDRHIDGQTTDNGARPYRQADGQQTPDNYTQPTPNRVPERRPIGLDRMVPGEPSNDEYSQYQGTNYTGTNEHRVVTGVDHDFAIPADAGPPDVREQNVDGSDYTEQNLRNPSRNVIGARESSSNVSPVFSAPPEEQLREVTMEGENLQDLSNISSAELTFSRYSEQVLDGPNVTHPDLGNDRKTDLSDSIDHPATSSRRQSLNRVNTSGEDSERDRAFKSSPRRDRDKHKSSRDRDRDRAKDRERDRDRDKDGRYSRGDRKYDPDRRSVRDDRRSEKDRRDRDGYRERRDRGDSPTEARRQRRSNRSHRYETEDTEYYSDRERDRRRHREGSYTSKPPRPDDKDRWYDERDRSKRYNTIERDRRYDDEREPRRRSERYRERDRYERAYRDIDPARKYASLRKTRDKDDRRVVTFSPDAKTNDSCMQQDAYSSPSRPDSRGEATATDDDGPDARRRDRRSRRTAEPFYDEYASGGAYPDAYLAQQQQYAFLKQLRYTNPAAYTAWYKQYEQYLGGHGAWPAPPAQPGLPAHSTALYDEFGSLPYEARAERGSVHSGRSSTTGLKGNDTYYGYRLERAASLRDAPSLRTDVSDRDLNTDMSLNLHLEESTVRSERMTPFRYSTAHIKGSIASRDVVVVRPMYPVDGAPATVHVVSLAAALAQHPDTLELSAFPGPLVKGVTHKKSVIDYCGVRIRSAQSEGARDVTGYVLVWDLLALMLRQNGVVVGSDIAELLMKNTREYEYKLSGSKTFNESRRGSSEACETRDDERTSSPEQPSLSASDNINQESLSSAGRSADERGALDKLRELLIYGNRQEAIECAARGGLWGHALALAAHGERRTRAAVAARFVGALARHDPLHTLYAALGAAPPPAATCVADERWGDWRPHVAIILSNPSAKPEQDRRTLTQLGDSLNSRGLLYSAQFCYLSAGVQFSRHPLAPLPPGGASGAGSGPPRLALLLADSRADTLQQLASNRALFATEVYEYALSLSQDDFLITELQAYKLVLACRLADCGQYERALAYTEAAARAVMRAPRHYSPALVAHLATLADRLKYHDPALQDDPPLVEEADSEEPSPRHQQQWLDDVKSVAQMLSAESAQASPQHQLQPAPVQPEPAPPQYGWGEPPQVQQYQPAVQQPVPTYAEPAPEETPDYPSHYYPQQTQQPPLQQQQPAQQQPADEPPQYGHYEEWPRAEEPHQQYADPYWQPDQPYGYGEARGSGAEARPSITMPGARAPRAPYDYDDDRPPSADQNERDTDTPKTAAKKQESRKEEGAKGEAKAKGGGWLGGILTKLSLRAPNQMILPDDKNPSIVWDPDTKRWRNVDGDADEPELPPPPPPKTQDLPHALQSASPPLPAVPTAGAPPSMAPAAPVSNIFKMQKGRHIKKSYVDVFNPPGAPPAAAPGPAPPPAPPAPPANYFVPAPLPQDAIHDDLLDAIEVSIPPITPPTTPTYYSRKKQNSIYDPSLLDTGDEMYRSGI